MRFHKLIYTAVVLLTVGGLASCSKKDDLSKPILGLEGDSWAKTPLDEWLTNNFTIPYNMEVKYRWDASEFGVQYTLVPPDTARVRMLMSVVKSAWMDLYVAEVNETFLKKLAPKQYQLIGSLRYNGSTVTLGEAEGGSTVRIFDVNTFDIANREKVKRVLKTIHHEFTHILNQTINYPLVDFQSITKSGYIGTWNQTSVAEAREEGFISNYAKAAPGEDFAEMVSIMITEGRLGYAEILGGIKSEAAKAAIRQKETIVATYLKQVWNIDLYSMMDRCQAALSDLGAPPSLHPYIGYGKAFPVVTVNFADPMLNESFKTVAQAASAQLGTLGNAGRYIELFTLNFDQAGRVRLRITYRNPSSPTSIYNADFLYELTVADDIYTLVYQGPPAESVTENNNARTIQNYVTTLTRDFLEGQFRLAWPEEAPPVGEPPYYGGFYKVTDPTVYFLGAL